jgi:hypothetical protein
MAKAKAQQRVIYHQFICGDDLGEGDAFFKFDPDGELVYIDGWDCNDAHWRGEYMSGILAHLGAEVKQLPEKYRDLGAKLYAEAFGLDYEPKEDEEPLIENESLVADLYFQEGTSDKEYHLSLTSNDKDNSVWLVFADYGRVGRKLKRDFKGEGLEYEDAKALYDRVLNEKLKKGYKTRD